MLCVLFGNENEMKEKKIFIEWFVFYVQTN